MANAFLFTILTVFLFTIGFCNALECYHCYTGGKYENKGAQFVPCNEGDLSLSNTWQCPSAKARCIYQLVQIESTQSYQTWRTCSNGISDPCDPNALPPGIKMLKCTHCGTDKCNLNEKEAEKDKNTFTFNINANINLFIRQ